MINSIVLCLLAVSSAFAVPLSETKVENAGGCPGGYAEGAEIERGRLVFVCQGGQVVPKGCIAEDLSRLSIGGNYDTKQYRKKCQSGGDGQLAYELIGCLSNGQEHKVGESWEDGNSFYTCQTDGAALKVISQGCVDGGKRINFKDTVAKDNALYACDEAPNGGHKLVQAGCVKDGKQYKAGDSYEEGNAWFNCTRIGREKYTAKVAGCFKNGKRLNDGDSNLDNDVAYQCIVESGKATFRANGCVQKDGGSIIERHLGCTWIEGTAPLQYQVECKHDAAADTAAIVQNRCNYNPGGGVYQIEPGCFRVIGKESSIFGCVKQGEKLNLQSFQAESGATGAGLRAC